jgi:hypothetical protein
MPVAKPVAAVTNEKAVKHLDKARRNYAFFLAIQHDPTRTEWAVTILFYTALHLIQAYLWQVATSAFDVPRNHKERDNHIGLKMPSEVYASYRKLQDESTFARYHIDKPTLCCADVQRIANKYFVPLNSDLASLNVHLVLPAKPDSPQD